jgi:hypothetical protein
MNMMNFKIWLNEVGDSPWDTEEKPPIEKIIKNYGGEAMPKAYPPNENSDEVNPELPPAKRKFGKDKFKMKKMKQV